MTDMKAEFHEHLTRPGVKYDEEMSICLLEGDLKMSKSRDNVVIFDENVSYLSTSITGAQAHNARSYIVFFLLLLCARSVKRDMWHILLHNNTITICLGETRLSPCSIWRSDRFVWKGNGFAGKVNSANIL